MNIVIMAGGSGTRLWPVSRDKTPKQFTALVGRSTLLQQTFVRARAVTRSLRNIVVTTRREYVAEVRRQLPRFPKEQILVEPVRRDTGPSVGLAAAFFAAQGRHDESLIQMASDHVFRNEALCRVGLRAQGALLRTHEDWTVLLGAEPTYPETGYGYIERGPRVGRAVGMPVHAVRRFVEKPTLVAAKRYLRAGRFLWNISMYGWRIRTLLEMFHQYQPAIARRLDRIERLYARKAPQKALDREYLGMPSISLDYAITEHQDPGRIVVLPGDFRWTDVGHWASLAEVLGAGAAVEVKRGSVVRIKSGGNFVYSDVSQVIGLVGVHNLIVVATPDALLVCDKANAQDVKQLVAELARRNERKYL